MGFKLEFTGLKAIFILNYIVVLTIINLGYLLFNNIILFILWIILIMLITTSTFKNGD